MGTIANNKVFKLLTAVLIILLVGLGIYTIKFYNTVQDNAVELVREKEMIKLELSDILQKYNAQQGKTIAVRKQLNSAQSRIKKLLDSLATSENTRGVLRNYRFEINQLRDQRDQLLVQNDSLAKLATNLKNESTAVKQAFDSSIVERDSLRQQNKVLREELNARVAMSIDSLNAHGIIVRRSGRHIVNELAKRIDDIEVCYQLKGTVTSDKTVLYIQVIDPQNNVMGSRKTINFNDKVLIYSATEVLDGDTFNSDSPRCILMAPDVARFQEGIYRVNIFEKDRIMASTLLQLD
ncbi:MAG: hypothetical protein WA951_07730 [Leeuwenhoekiella sp.]